MNTPGYGNTTNTRNLHRKMRLHHGHKGNLREFARGVLHVHSTTHAMQTDQDRAVYACAKRWATAKHMTVTP